LPGKQFFRCFAEFQFLCPAEFVWRCAEQQFGWVV
jgi:hypothetical protein